MFKYEYVENLPDAYNKQKTSNNYKILQIEQNAQAQSKNDITDIFNSLDIDKATGTTLDLYGKMYNAPRGNLDDIQYRILIKTRINQNRIDGSYESILNSICRIFNCNPDEFHMEDSESSCTVKITNIPFRVINYIGLNSKETIDLIESLIPVGISVESASFDGTFEFSKTESDYNESAGFSDIEGGTIGGYFGILYGENSNSI